jgi:hypothetical protein
VSTSVVKCSWMKCSEDLNNKAFNIIRRFIEHMKFAATWFFVYHILLYCLVIFLSFYMYFYCYVCFFLCIFIIM